MSFESGKSYHLQVKGGGDVTQISNTTFPDKVHILTHCPDATEQVWVAETENYWVSFRSVKNNKYLGPNANGDFHAYATEIGDRERFQVQPIGPNSFSLVLPNGPKPLFVHENWRYSSLQLSSDDTVQPLEFDFVKGEWLYSIRCSKLASTDIL